MNKSSAIYALLFMMVISVTFGVGLSAVHHATLDTMAKNETLNKNRTLSRAFLLEVAEDSPEAFQEAVDRSISVETIFHEGRTFEVCTTNPPMQNRVGFIFTGYGFWGPIKGIAVLSEDLQTMVNIQFLEHQETPGLGARIEEPWFTDQFKGLEIGWNELPARRVIIGGVADPTTKNRVDAITGASQTSIALMKSLNAELESFRKAYTSRK
jgi:Na+-transporting NADH:ubiquinone oxidoreductase subunit C